MDEVEQLRHDAAAEAWTIERVVRDIEHVNLFDRKLREACRAQREQLVPALVDTMRARGGYAKVAASVLLFCLGDEHAMEGFVDVLTRGDEEERTALLAHLAVVPCRPPMTADGQAMLPPTTVDGAALDRALVPLLRDPSSHLGGLAFDVMIRFDTPSAPQHVSPLLDSSDANVRQKAIRWLAARHDATALDAIADMLTAGAEEERDALIHALSDYADSNDANVRERAATIAAAFVRAALDRDDNATANHVMIALRTLERIAPRWEAKLLEEVVRSHLCAWARGIALERLAALDDEGERVVVEALASDDLREAAAQALAARRGDSQEARAALVRALEAELRATTPSTSTVRAIARALVRRGHAAEPLLNRAAARLDRWERTTIAWLREGIRPSDVLRRLVQAGIIDAVDADDANDATMAALERAWDDEPSARAVTFALLGREGTAVWRDAESPIDPPDYVALVHDLARLSRGALAIDFASQEPAPGKPVADGVVHVAVQFVERERVVRFRAAYRGDWFDVAATLCALDLAIEQRHRPERFFAVHTGDQSCFVVCADAEAFRRVARSLHIPIDEDADAAVRCGVGFEAHVLGRGA